MTDIERLRTIIAAATPAPWKFSTGDKGIVFEAGEDDSELGEVWGDDTDPLCWPITANAKLVTTAINELPALLDELERLRAIEAIGQRQQKWA